MGTETLVLYALTEPVVTWMDHGQMNQLSSNQRHDGEACPRDIIKVRKME
jgi:hypothetical protein